MLAGATAPRLSWLLAGSAGLGRQWRGARSLFRRHRPAPTGPRLALGGGQPVRGESRPGSPAALQAAGAAGVYLRRASEDAGAAAPDSRPVLRALDQGRPAFIASAPGAPLARARPHARWAWPPHALAAAAPDVLAVTGGETAYAVLQSVGATRPISSARPPAGSRAAPSPSRAPLRLMDACCRCWPGGRLRAPDLFLTLLGPGPHERDAGRCWASHMGPAGVGPETPRRRWPSRRSCVNLASEGRPPAPSSRVTTDPPPPAEDLAPGGVPSFATLRTSEKGAGHAAATTLACTRCTQPRGRRTIGTSPDRLWQWEIFDGGRLAIGAASQRVAPCGCTGKGDVDYMDTADGYYDVTYTLMRAFTRQLYT